MKLYFAIFKLTNIYLEMETVAVVCDDNIECALDRDEALCRTGADKYNPIAYAMTALMCLIYVVLKLVWFFHLQHQPVGDEEDDMEMEEIEAVAPSSEDSIRYRQALDQLDRVYEINKALTGYISSDSEDETGE